MKEELLDLIQHDSDVRNALRDIKGTRESQKVRKFRRDVAKWVDEVSNGVVNKNGVQNGLYGTLRLKLGLKSMNGLSDDQLDQAYKVFEEYKQLIA